MTENQIYRNAARALPATLVIVLLAGCATSPTKRISSSLAPRDYWTEKKQKIRPHKKRAVVAALEKVMRKAASGRSLESLGISTLKEAVVLLEEPKAAAPFIADAIYGKNLWSGRKSEPYYWKFRYWCVDMTGYLKEKRFVPILSSIVSGVNERNELRIRAVKALREMKAESILKKLFFQTDNSAVREEIAKAVISFD